jgi:hypothetical protein
LENSKSFYIAEKIKAFLTGKPFPEEWSYKRVQNWSLNNKRNIKSFGDFEQVSDDIKAELYKIITEDIPSFEKRIAEELSK